MAFRPALPASVLARLERPSTPTEVVIPVDPGPAIDRAKVREAERTLQAGAGMKRVEARSSAPAEIKGATAAELAGPLALKAMRVLERGMDELDYRVAFEAARVAATVAPKVHELTAGPVEDADPEARRAALLAALASDEFCVLLIDVLQSTESPAHRALCEAGWSPPGYAADA